MSDTLQMARESLGMYLGIDLGTSAVKACIIDDRGAVSATASASLSVLHPFREASEQDCDAWWTGACKAVRGLPPEARARVCAIGLSGQMHGAVLLDAAHKPIRPAILWNDGRATAECAAMTDAEPQVGQLSGVPPMPGFTAPKLLWLARHEPKTHTRIAHVLLPKDYIGLCLHGACVTDPSDAAGTGWLDQQRRAWSDRLCEISATDPAWLPDLRNGADIAGQLLPGAAEDLGLPAGIPVATGAGDAAAGAVGIGAIEEGDGFLSLGTSGQLFVTTRDYRPNPESRIHAYAHTLPDRWFQMAAMLNGARPIAWLAGLLDRPIEALLAEAESASTGPLFLPYLMGERTPHGDAAIRGGFAMLGETTTQGSLMRAVLEAIAFTFADAMAALAEAGTKPDSLLAIGGGARNDLLMQMIADATGCPLARSDGADVGPALGAARLALASTGMADPASVMAKPEPNRWFKPSPDAAEGVQDRLAAYRALYPALKRVQKLL
ncbi:Xylulose kinase (plasmid) [Rhodovulum sp. P5]|uniref:xylulokinase n=1 Tax=Rhodovulum sp. P5 TaxID=1564506 RepID=UPI0009C2D7D0|nr:xylulokinase [Rhodovulum sp. P5]ARE42444.1 Xylulose kinase [Rhodovulum sp. P5]